MSSYLSFSYITFSLTTFPCILLHHSASKFRQVNVNIYTSAALHYSVSLLNVTFLRNKIVLLSRTI